MNKEMEIQMNEFEEFREKKDTGFSLKISNLREEMEKAKFLLAGLYAINDLEFFIGIYDDNTKKVKLINNSEKKPKIFIFIEEFEGYTKMYIQIKLKESYMISKEEVEKLHEEHTKKYNQNPLTT